MSRQAPERKEVADVSAVQGSRNDATHDAGHEEKRRMYAVLADDLTGAGDTGVQFAQAGLKTRALMGDWSGSAAEGADVVVINTDSRALAPQAAYDVVAEAAACLKDVGARPVYKKIDSTMRGPVGAEVDAVLDVFEQPMAVVCPAFPDNGRIVIGGCLLVSGEPVARTSISRDPVAPVRKSSLCSLLAAQTRRPVYHVGLDVLDEGEGALEQRLAALVREGECVVVVDAMTDGDLAAIVKATTSMREQVLLVGSAGLAQPLAEELAKERKAPSEPVLQRGALVVVGSVNPVSRRQMERLEEMGGVQFVHLDVQAAMADDQEKEQTVDGACRVVRQAASAGRIVVLTTPGEREDIEAAQKAGAQRGMGPGEVAARIAQALGRIAAAALEEAPLAGVVATGGDTAQALLDLLGADGIDLVAEVLPGIPFGRVHGGRRPGLQIVTKAGGFGGPDALVQAATYLVGLS